MPNHSDHELPQELLELEEQLCELVPASVCCELHSRLEESMLTSVNAEVDFEESTQELEALEVHLKEMAPVSMPANMLDRMAQAMDQWQEAEFADENIIGFRDSDLRKKTKSKLFGVGFLSAAAAVALIAAVTALVIPDIATKGTKTLAQNTPPDFNASDFKSPDFSNQSSNIRGISAPSIASGNAASMSPMAEVLTSKVINSKETIIYDDAKNPFRFVEVEYLDQVKVKSRDGRDVILSRPRKDGYLIPIKVY
ncbi:hypothetical protein N9496_02930 [Akkermansiaceae bacterium]|nr:hypothetical protein [Akkermansiaceae bacterium]